MEAFMSRNQQNDKLSFLKFQLKLEQQNKILINFEQIFDIEDKMILDQAIGKCNRRERRVHMVA